MLARVCHLAAELDAACSVRNSQPHIAWLLKFVEFDALWEAAARTGDG
jgi:hypothetical protein